LIFRQRCQNNGNDVFNSLLCDTFTLDISLCRLLNVFSCPQSLTTSHLSQSQLFKRRRLVNTPCPAMRCNSSLVELKGEIKDYLDVLDKGELDAEIDQFLSGKNSRGGFECHSFDKKTKNKEPHSTKWKVRGRSFLWWIGRHPRRAGRRRRDRPSCHRRLLLLGLITSEARRLNNDHCRASRKRRFSPPDLHRNSPNVRYVFS
jgi:hypothetical protein